MTYKREKIHKGKYENWENLMHLMKTLLERLIKDEKMSLYFLSSFITITKEKRSEELYEKTEIYKRFKDHIMKEGKKHWVLLDYLVSSSSHTKTNPLKNKKIPVIVKIFDPSYSESLTQLRNEREGTQYLWTLFRSSKKIKIKKILLSYEDMGILILEYEEGKSFSAELNHFIETINNTRLLNSSLNSSKTFKKLLKSSIILANFFSQIHRNNMVYGDSHLKNFIISSSPHHYLVPIDLEECKILINEKEDEQTYREAKLYDLSRLLSSYVDQTPGIFDIKIRKDFPFPSLTYDIHAQTALILRLLLSYSFFITYFHSSHNKKKNTISPSALNEIFIFQLIKGLKDTYFRRKSADKEPPKRNRILYDYSWKNLEPLFTKNIRETLPILQALLQLPSK